MRERRVFSFCLAGLALVAPAFALSYQTVADHHLAETAPLVVTGEVLAGAVDGRSGKVFTRYDIAIDEILKGDYPGSVLELRVLGGIDREAGLGLVVFGTPEFAKGERVMLFLGPNDDGSFHVQHFQQGAFHERSAGDRRFFTRPMTELFEPRRPSERASGETALVRDRERFVDWVRQGDFSQLAMERYLVDRPALVDNPFVQSFTSIAGNDLIVRWPNFDDANGDGLPRGKVVWDRHPEGIPGASVNEKKMVKNGTKHWRTRSGAPINIRPGKKRSSTTGFDSSDGRQIILWRDHNGDIRNDFSCFTGGTLAIGGISFIFRVDDLEWKDKEYIPTAEAEIIFNDGVSCRLNAKDTEKVVTHEIGHTLGFGHTCDDSDSPDCDTFEHLADSIMAAFLDSDRPNARPSLEDTRMARFFYDPNFQLVPCDKKPGFKNFCKRCGPCGEGQGNCKNNRQCVGDLICAADNDPDTHGKKVCQQPAIAGLFAGPE